MTLRRGKELKEPSESGKVQLEIEREEPKPVQNKNTFQEVGENKKEHYKPAPTFPYRLRATTPMLDKKNQETLETSRKVEINIPLLDSIKHAPDCAKFLKEL